MSRWDAEVRAERSFTARALYLHGWHGKREDNTYQVFDEVVMITTLVPPGARTEPFLAMSDEAGQVLFNDLWNAGYRPPSIGTAGHVEAMKEHIKDLRESGQAAMGLLRTQLEKKP